MWQAEVFEHVVPLLDSALTGINVTVFAYGQTGTGKTTPHHFSLP